MNKRNRLITLNNAFRGLVAFVLAVSFLASPALVSADTTTFRPDAAGYYQTWTIFGGSSTRWQATSDQSDSTGVQITADTTSRETENLQDTSQTGIINSVTAYMKAKAIGTLAQVKYIAAGAGSGTTGNPAPTYPAGLQTNDLILLQVTVRDTTTTPTTPTGFTLLYGPDLTTTGRQWIYYRFSNGTETGTLQVTIGGSNCKIARMYSFRNVALSSFTEGGGFGSGTGATISAQAVTTTGIRRLAVSFVFVNDDNAVDSFTGETGGDWVEAAEFNTTTGSDGAVQLQNAIMASAGTISGGTYGMAAADPWGVRAFALIPTVPTAPERQVTYVAAGTASGVTGNPTPAYPAGLQTNDLILLQVTVRDTSTTPTTPAGFTSLYGPDVTTLGRQWIYYRFSSGGETGTITVPIGGSVCKIACMYAFRNVALSSFTEGGGFGSGTGAAISAQAVTTTNIRRLAVSFVFVNDDNTLGSFTGETGGDWVSAATFTTTAGSDGAVQLQTAIMASAGTISGGTYGMAAADPWGVRAFALIPIDPEERAVILWRTHDADYESSAQTISRTAFADYSEPRATNPNTGLAWTWTEVNALQVGSRALTLGAGETIQFSEYWIVVDYTLCTITAPSSVCANSTGNNASVPDAGVGATYAWTITTGNGTITAGQGTRSITWSASSTSPVNIGVTVTKGGNQCISSTDVTVIPIPGCTIEAPPSVYTNSTGNNASVPDAGVGATYDWTINNGTITDGDDTPSITWSAGIFSPVTIGITITVSGCQCDNSTDVIVTTPPALSVYITGNLAFCEGGSTTLTAHAGGGIPPYTYDWSASDAPGSYQDNEYTAIDEGTVTVTVSDNTTCSSTIVSDNTTMVTQGNVPGATYPHNAALAYVHPSWWSGLDYKFDYYSDNVCRWIWESEYVVHPVEGDIVYFERSFDIPGPPIGATCNITCDNGYEVYINPPDINPTYLGRAQLDDYGGISWEMSNLSENWTHSSGWQSVESYNIPAAMLKSGTNILEIRAANELMESGSGTPLTNPGGVIYELVYEFNCTASTSVDVTMNPTPTATAESNSPVEEGATIELYGGPDYMDSYSWTGPNSFTSDQQSPSISNATVAMAGEYILTVTNSYGCQDDASENVTVNAASIPEVTVNIYDTLDPNCTGPSITNMTPQVTWYAKVSVTSNSKLRQLETVRATIFYNDGIDPNKPAPGGGDLHDCGILICNIGGPPGYSITWDSNFGTSSTWDLVEAGCQSPASLEATSGDWIFAFQPGTVARENTGATKWNVQGYAKNRAPDTKYGEAYVRDKDMNWYGEITVNTTEVDWGEVPMGLTFGTDAGNGNPQTVSIHYIANGDYYENISSTDWSNSGPPVETVTLDETGSGDPPALPGMFALKANDIDDLDNAIIVKSGSYEHTNDAGVLTTEAGVDVTTNRLWLSLSQTGIAPVTYSGTIYYQIANR